MNILLSMTISPIPLTFSLLDTAHTSNLVARNVASPQQVLWVITNFWDLFLSADCFDFSCLRCHSALWEVHCKSLCKELVYTRETNYKGLPSWRQTDLHNADGAKRVENEWELAQTVTTSVKRMWVLALYFEITSEISKCA